MSEAGAGAVVIRYLIQSGQFTADECVRLAEIANRSPARVSYKDTLAVARIVHKKLRSP